MRAITAVMAIIKNAEGNTSFSGITAATGFSDNGFKAA